MAVVVVGTSLWVFFDSKALGARRGLVPGLADLTPAGWLIGCLLLWIVGFPLYLASRERIRNAAEKQSGSAGGPLAAPEPGSDAVRRFNLYTPSSTGPKPFGVALAVLACAALVILLIPSTGIDLGGPAPPSGAEPVAAPQVRADNPAAARSPVALTLGETYWEEHTDLFSGRSGGVPCAEVTMQNMGREESGDLYLRASFEQPDKREVIGTNTELVGKIAPGYSRTVKVCSTEGFSSPLLADLLPAAAVTVVLQEEGSSREYGQVHGSVQSQLR